MLNRIAVIDLGTNTFHLLIAERMPGGFRVIIRRTEAVKLGEGGINDRIIRPDAFKRGLETMLGFSRDIGVNKAVSVQAIATSAIRNAVNGPDFINEVKYKTGISIEVIDGMREAGLIYQGVKASGCLAPTPSLIIDIGGGSVEFIVGNDQTLVWKQSFEIGAARMMDLFHRTDPVPPASVGELKSWLNARLSSLFEYISQSPVHHLIGSSGAFETFAQLIETGKGNELDLDSVKAYDFQISDFGETVLKLVSSNHQERLEMKGIIPLRVDMVVTAAILTSFILEKLKINQLSMSTYSLKEGVLAEALDDCGF